MLWLWLLTNPRPSVVWQHIIVKDVWPRPSLLGKGALGRAASPLPMSCLLRVDSHASSGPATVGRENREVHSMGFRAETWDTGFPSSSSISVAVGENSHCSSLYTALWKKANACKPSARYMDRLQPKRPATLLANETRLKQSLIIGNVWPQMVRAFAFLSVVPEGPVFPEATDKR